MADHRFLARLNEARSASLATVSADGQPHIVPIVFAFDNQRIVTAIDHKPKTTRLLKRLRNIAQNDRVSVLVDHYSDDWAQLWWVRVDGTARVLGEGPVFETAIDALVARYEQYRLQRPDGPVIEIMIERVSGWDAESVD